MTSPVRRTPPPSIAVAMETVRREALSSHRPQTGKLRPREAGLGPIAWAGKRLLSPITTLWRGDLFRGLWIQETQAPGERRRDCALFFLLAGASPRSCQSPACSLGTISEQMEKPRVGGNPLKVPFSHPYPQSARVFLEPLPTFPVPNWWQWWRWWKVGGWGEACRASVLKTAAELLHSWLRLTKHSLCAR